jgi:hypothetical protein
MGMPEQSAWKQHLDLMVLLTVVNGAGVRADDQTDRVYHVIGPVGTVDETDEVTRFH